MQHVTEAFRALTVAPVVPDHPDTAASRVDRALVLLFTLSLMLLFASPARFLYLPIPYAGSYVSFIPPNVIDLAWLVTGAVLYLRVGRISSRWLLALSGLILLGGGVLTTSDGLTYEAVTDLVLFTLRLFGGLGIGAMVANGVVAADRFGTLLALGAGVVAVSTVVLLGGGVSYDLYSNDLRFGGMGLGSNEAGIVFAAALNLLPGIFSRARWTALLSPLLLTALLATGSRTAFLLALPATLLWIPTLRRNFSGRGAVIAWTVFLIMTSILLAFEVQVSGGLVRSGSVAPVVGRLGVTTDESTIGRITIYASVPAYLLSHPAAALLGVGGSNVAVESFLQNVLAIWTYHTHNLLLQLWAAFGIAGIALLVAMVWPLLRRPSRFPDEASRGVRWFGLTMAGGQALQYGLFQEKFLLLFALVAGYIAAISSRRAPGREA